MAAADALCWCAAGCCSLDAGEAGNHVPRPVTAFKLHVTAAARDEFSAVGGDGGLTGIKPGLSGQEFRCIGLHPAGIPFVAEPSWFQGCEPGGTQLRPRNRQRMLDRLVLADADCLDITHIQAEYDGDTWFPPVDWSAWRIEAEQRIAADGQTPAHRFVTWVRAAV